MNRDQQTARENVSDEDWIHFRTLAMRRRQSLAEYLGELVRSELDGSSSSSSPGREPGGAAADGTPATRRSVPSVRLSERRLLTELPRPEPEPAPPWEE